MKIDITGCQLVNHHYKFLIFYRYLRLSQKAGITPILSMLWAVSALTY